MGERSIFMAEQNNQLYVTNLPWEVDESGLEEIFSEYGAITECSIPTRKGRSLGFGFVTFGDAECAAAAMEAMAGARVGEVEGAREIAVKIAREKGAGKQQKQAKKPAAPAPAPAPKTDNNTTEAPGEQRKSGVEDMVQSVPIPANAVGWVMGKNGANINKMQKQSGCVLRLQDNEWKDFGRMWKYISLRGSGRNVDRAKKLIYLSLEKF